jgi:hypothetical protein
VTEGPRSSKSRSRGARGARGALGEGAALEAPTAPHATPPGDPSAPRSRRKRTGPERFWRRRSARLAFATCLLLSAAGHYAIAPFEVPHGFEIKDVEGDAVIPVEVLTAEAPPPEPPPPPAEAPTSARSDDAKEGAARHDAGALHDAGEASDASDVHDAAPPHDAAAPSDAAIGDASSGGALADGGPTDAGNGAGDGGLLAEADAGNAGANGIVGAAIQADVNLVTLVVNAEVIRQHPVGAHMGYMLRGIPQWDEFMNGTDIDPVRDADWVQVAGPSLVNTARDVVLIHYSCPDATVDRAIAVVSKKYDRGGPYDAGVPGVKATLAHADRAERVLLRAQPHVLAVVPPSIAEKSARALTTSRLPAHNHPGEAVYLRLVNPHHPMPEVPESITEMRLRVVPRPDLGADVFIEGDTKDASAATDAAGELRKVARRHNDAFTAMLTHGLLDRVEVTTDGSLVKAHIPVTLDQIQTITALVSSFLGLEPPASSSPAPGSAPPRAPGH